MAGVFAADAALGGAAGFAGGAAGGAAAGVGAAVVVEEGFRIPMIESEAKHVLEEL